VPYNQLRLQALVCTLERIVGDGHSIDQAKSGMSACTVDRGQSVLTPTPLSS
jgi:hypothetical protein